MGIFLQLQNMRSLQKEANASGRNRMGTQATAMRKSSSIPLSEISNQVVNEVNKHPRMCG